MRHAATLGFAVLFVLFAAVANASSFSIDVALGGGMPTHIIPDLVEISPGVFTGSGHQAVAGSFDLAWNLHLEDDPAITGSFTLTNLSAITQTFSVSATLGGLVPLPAPTLMGGSVGNITTTDLSGEGIVSLDTTAVTPFYRAQIDGASVQDLLSNLHLGPAPTVFPMQQWGTPIPSAPGPGVLTSIGVAFPGFSLTAGDQVNTPFEFTVVVPEPATGALIALGLVTLAWTGRARRRA